VKGKEFKTYSELTQAFIDSISALDEETMEKVATYGYLSTTVLAHMTILLAGIADGVNRIATALEGGNHEEAGHQDPGGDESGHIGAIHGGLPESDQA